MKRIFVWIGIVTAGLGLQAQNTEILETARKHAKTLAAPEMAGRGYQEDGHLLAAQYIAGQFESFGLKPVPGIGNGEFPWFQQFSFATQLVEDLSLELNGVEMVEGEDFIAMSGSGRGDLPLGKVVRVGHGMPYDYKKSVKGKIVVMEAGLPKKVKEDGALKEKYKSLASPQAKVDLARKAGASGVIVLKEKLTAGFSPIGMEIPVLEVAKDEMPCKKVKKAEMMVEASLTRIKTQNVIGMVEGKTHPDSVVILCAHYDHLGKQGDAIFYGGNDNASGTSMLLSMAEHFSRPENQPNYTMLFIGFGAEEAGLHGSRYYVREQPAKPLANTAFVLNMDLMANGDEGITAVAGLDFPNRLEILKQLNEKQQAVPKVKARGNRANSDHYFFVEEGVPAMFIFTLGGPPHYHDINDTYEEMRFSRYMEVRSLMISFAEAMMVH